MGCTSIKPGHTTRPDRGTLKKARLLAKGRFARVEKRPPNATGTLEAALVGGSRRASAHRRGVPAAVRGHAMHCLCASRPRRHPRRTDLRPPRARRLPRGSRRALARYAVPAARRAWGGSGLLPQAWPRLRQIAHPASQRACGSAHRAWRRRVWRRDRPNHLRGRVRVPAERSSPGQCDTSTRRLPSWVSCLRP